MKITFQRITTKDRLELHGLLFEPERKTTKDLIHIHGWMGNFYENRFIDHIAKELVSRGYAFFTFNNRGAGIINDFIKRGKFKVGDVRIGGSLEEFKDCLFDVRAAIDLLSKKGYKRIILQGHSLGCQKATFYKYKTKDRRVGGLVLLAPVDDVAFSKRRIRNRYKESLDIALEMVKGGRDNYPVPKWMAFYPLLNAGAFSNVADPKSASGRIFDYAGRLKEIKNVRCPILAVFGSKDEYQHRTDAVLKTLEESVKNCDTELVQGAGHGFVGFETKVSKVVAHWLSSK